MDNTWIKETTELLDDLQKKKVSLEEKINELLEELDELERKIAASHALIRAYMEKHNIDPQSLGDVAISYLSNMSYPEMLVEIAQKRQGYLKVADAVELLLRANVNSDRRAIQANIYSALRRLGKRFIKMAPGEYRYTNHIPKQRDTKPSGVRQAVKELKEKNPQSTKEDILSMLLRDNFDFHGRNPKKAVHMAWISLGYAKKEKQPVLKTVTLAEVFKQHKQDDLFRTS
jgi:hypothetical protein